MLSGSEPLVLKLVVSSSSAVRVYVLLTVIYVLSTFVKLKVRR